MASIKPVAVTKHSTGGIHFPMAAGPRSILFRLSLAHHRKSLRALSDA
jgi:hypothetical protein